MLGTGPLPVACTASGPRHPASHVDPDCSYLCRPYAFKAVYSVSLHGEKLRTDFRVFNTGDKPFEFTAALHTYFEVADVSKAKVNGLQNLKYLDKVSRHSSLLVFE